MSELPTGWTKKALRDCVTKLVDGSHNPPPKSDTGLPMLSARNINEGQIIFDEYRLIKEQDFRLEDKRTDISAGDVLLTIVGALGRSAVVPTTAPKFTLQRSVAVMKPFRDVDPYFLSYHFASPGFQEWINDNAKGTAQKGVYLKALGQYSIPVPPLNEQRRIVARLNALFAHLKRARAELARVSGLVEGQKKTMALLDRLDQATLAKAFQGEL